MADLWDRWLWRLIVVAAATTVGYAATHTFTLAPIFFAGVLAASWVAFCQRRPDMAAAVIVALVAFSSHLFAFAHNYGAPPGVVRLAILAKDAAVWLLLLSLTLRALRARARAGPLILLGAYLTVIAAWLVAVDNALPLYPQITAVRGVLIPVAALAVVTLLTQDERAMVARIAVPMVAIACLYGMLEALLLPPSWMVNVIGVGTYWVDVKQAGLFVDPSTNLPGNFFTSQGVPRLAGPFGDPLAAGMTIGSTLVLAVATKDRLPIPRITILVLAVGLVMTFTRGGWVLAAAGLLGLFIAQVGPGRALARVMPAVAALVAAFAFVGPLREYVGAMLEGRDGSTVGHQEALAASLTHDFTMTGSGWGKESPVEWWGLRAGGEA